MGSGKTLSMTVISSLMARITNTPLYANYHVEGAEYLTTVKKLWEVQSAIFNFDEIWLTMDARRWKDNVMLTRWVNQTRKKMMIVFYTTQHIRQVELRVRTATDVLIYCERKPEGIWLQFIDYQYRTVGRRYLLEKPERFYNLYDTYEVLEPLSAK